MEGDLDEAVPLGVRMREPSMNGQKDEASIVYSRADDTAARLVAYLSPYLFWGTVGVIVSGIFLLA